MSDERDLYDLLTDLLCVHAAYVREEGLAVRPSQREYDDALLAMMSAISTTEGDMAELRNNAQ